MKISGSQAFENARNNTDRTMHRFYEKNQAYADIMHKPKFQLVASDGIFTIGSCFARNIENALHASGVNVLSDVIELPGDYYEIGGARRTGYQNVYTPGSIYEAVSLATTSRPYHSIIESNGRYVDLLTSGLVPLTKEEVYAIRDGLIVTYKKLKEAGTLVITLGYNESWTYIPDGSYTNRAPSHMALRRRVDEFSFSRLGYKQSYDLVASSLSILRDISPLCKVILTVSPVPLGDTFTSESVVVANQLSKATLRTVATDVAANYSFVDYFPSYEIIMNSDRSKTFLNDGMHVQGPAVENVIRQFTACYFNS